MHRAMTRRGFLQNVAWTGSGLIILADSRLVRGTQANSKLNIAGIGVGGRGGDDIAGVASENIVALCDVDAKRAAKAFAQFPKAKPYTRLPQDARRDAQPDRRRGRRARPTTRTPRRASWP